MIWRVRNLTVFSLLFLTAFRLLKSCITAQNHETLKLYKCGFIFLGTPHRGSTEADYGPTKLACAEHFGLRNTEVVQMWLYISRDATSRLHRSRLRANQACLCWAFWSTIQSTRLKAKSVQYGIRWESCSVERLLQERVSPNTVLLWS